MKRLAGLILVIAYPLAACSADGAGDGTTAAAPQDPVTHNAAAAPERSAVPAPVRVAQAPAGDAPYQEGKQFERLTPAQPTSSAPDKVEVAEAFMYTCPHCFTFENYISAWKERTPPSVEFIRIPVNFNAVAALHMRAYYVADTLGLLGDVHRVFFDEIHVNKAQLRTKEEIGAFFARFGVDAETFEKTWTSFAVDTKMRRAETLARRYKLSSVPTVIVNGKYRTDGRMAGSYPELIRVIDYLVGSEAGQPAAEATDSPPDAQ